MPVGFNNLSIVVPILKLARKDKKTGFLKQVRTIYFCSTLHPVFSIKGLFKVCELRRVN